jgi:(p)ppGpp synthase/HD superfamily hydrolase
MPDSEVQSNHVDAARDLARRAHARQTRKTGEPYFNHPDRVAATLSDSTGRAVAYLHDVLEDCDDPALLEELYRFPEPIVLAVKLLTRTPGETYFDFIHRILASGNQTAIAVKIADLKDNLRDLEEGHQKDKYRFALELLECRVTPHDGGSRVSDQK